MSQHEIFHELKVSKMSSSISCATSEISDLSITKHGPCGCACSDITGFITQFVEKCTAGIVSLDK